MLFNGLTRIAAAALFAITVVPTTLAEESPLNAAQQNAVRALVSEVLRENPELVMEALQTLQNRQELAKQKAQADMVVAHREQLQNDPDSPVAGNPNGSITIVEFMDYRCGYCKRAFAALQDVLKDDPDVRFVVKELPILGPDSVLAAKAALTVWKQAPDRYMDFHSALLTARGALSESRILKIAGDLGLDTTSIGTAMTGKGLDETLEKNVALAQALGISGTPAFVVGNQLVPGAIGADALRSLVEEARKG